MIFPNPLHTATNIGLIAPSSPVSREEGQRCVSVLRNMGFNVIVGDTVRRGDNIHGYLAGSARDRAADVNRMFANPKVDAVFCVRGGYGSSLILPYLDYSCIRRNPKIFAGYSDVTGIHTVLQRNCNLVSFHGPMVRPNLLPKPDDYTLRSLFSVCNMHSHYLFENPSGQEYTVIKNGCAEGILTGGNLSVLARSLGSAYAPAVNGKEHILFLEDIGESIPRIHMYLTQLSYAGMFEKMKGVLLGGFIGEEEDTDDGSMEEFLHEWFQNLGVPVIGNVCSDHRKPMGTLPLGAWCRMESKDGKVKIEFFR